VTVATSKKYQIFERGNMSTNIRWSMLIVLTVLTTGLLATGQTSQAPQGKSAMDAPTASGTEIHLQKLTEKLNLTDDQEAKLKPLLQDQSRQIKTVRDDASLSREQQQSKIKAIQESFRGQIDSVLTSEQQTKLKQMTPKSVEKHMGTRGETDHE
jgi:Spy/CpxP family protein refolding chaperone